MEEKRDKPEELNEEIRNLERHILLIEEELKRIDERTRSVPSRLGFEDLVQELVGAVVVALTVSLSDEVWSLAQKISVPHALFIFLFVLAVANLFVAYGNKRQWARQQFFGFLQLRLLTSAVISFFVAAVVSLLLGIYPNFVDTPSDYAKLVLLVASFSLVGSLGLDMAK